MINQSKLKLVSTMVTEEHVNIILAHLQKTIEADIIGDVVELGCNVGTTSIFIQEMLKKNDSIKLFHVYDSFEGVPAPTEEDENGFPAGAAKTTIEKFKETFMDNNIPMPIIHVGWFKDLQYPEKISFAFFDGDMYSSITDSFEKVYPKMSKGGVILVHDFGWERTQGVHKAIQNFLKDKPESIDVKDKIAIIVKQ